MSDIDRGSEDSIQCAGASLGKHRHVCAFFNSRDEEYGTLLPFIKEGFERGEKAFHIVDPALIDDHRRRLEVAEIDVTGAHERGQFQVEPWANAYLRDGHFDQDKMLALIEEVLQNGKTDGFPLTRLVAHMEWALEDRQGVDDLVKYETRLNQVLPKYRDPVICTYDLAKFNGSIVMDIMRTHPAVIVGGFCLENPFYVEPELFLSELQARADGHA
jgi:hypothetical protein